jgi:hypothetical protein
MSLERSGFTHSTYIIFIVQRLNRDVIVHQFNRTPSQKKFKLSKLCSDQHKLDLDSLLEITRCMFRPEMLEDHISVDYVV